MALRMVWLAGEFLWINLSPPPRADRPDVLSPLIGSYPPGGFGYLGLF